MGPCLGSKIVKDWSISKKFALKRSNIPVFIVNKINLRFVPIHYGGLQK